MTENLILTEAFRSRVRAALAAVNAPTISVPLTDPPRTAAALTHALAAWTGALSERARRRAEVLADLGSLSDVAFAADAETAAWLRR
ncbi:hypothetical protein [Corynebacterium frankenforstense]